MQPVAVYIQADTFFFQFYRWGIIDGEECGQNANFGVTVIGYGKSSDGRDYFLVKNTWGPTWGEGGFAKIARNDNIPGGVCGIAKKTYFPTTEPSAN